MSYEEVFWDDCTKTFREEQKQLIYAPRMGLLAYWGGAHPPTFDLQGRSIIDIGGGPVSLLLKCVNRGHSVICDPGEFPAWVGARYREAGIEYWRLPAERLEGEHRFDEALIYNVLQHVENPALVIENARRCAKTIRIFEWIDIPPYDGHPHMLTREGLEEWLGAPGFVSEIDEDGAHGRAFYGVFLAKRA